MSLLKMFQKEIMPVPGDYCILLKDYQDDLIEYLYNGKRWRFPATYNQRDHYWLVYTDEPEIAVPAEYDASLQSAEDQVLNFLKTRLKEDGEYQKAENTDSEKQHRLAEDLRPSVMKFGYYQVSERKYRGNLPAGEDFFEISYENRIWQYAGKKTEEGPLLLPGYRNVCKKLPFSEELHDELKKLEEEWSAYSKSSNGIVCQRFTREKYRCPEPDIRSVGRNEIAIPFSGSMYSFYYEWDGDNIIFTKTIQKLWPLGNRRCTEEEKRRVIEGTEECIAKRNLRYSDMDPDTYYSAGTK